MACLIVAAGAGSWDDLFARALWLPSILIVLLALRLMDDLGSLEYDRNKKNAPQHSQSADMTPLRRFMTTLAVLGSVSTLVFWDWVATLGVTALLSVYHLAYHLMPEKMWTPHRHLWVHLKYPALTLLFAWPVVPGDIGGALALYALFGVFELVDEQKFRRDTARLFYASAYGTLVALAVLLRLESQRAGEGLEEALIAGGLAAAFGIGVRGQKGVGQTLKYLPFAVGLLSLLISGNRVPG